MIRFVPFLCGLLVIGITNVASAQSRPDTDPYVSRQSLSDGITLATHHNGLTIIVQENHSAPVATVRCYVKNTGSVYEGKYLGAGLSHVLEHVVSGGTTNKRTEKASEELLDTLGGVSNAFTSLGLTAYFVDCPASRVNTAIDLVADWMQHCSFKPDEFTRELAVVQREMADRSNDRRTVEFHMLQKLLFRSHPARHPIIGYSQVLQDTQNEAIIDFYRDRYVPNNMVFVVVGDVNTSSVLNSVATQFQETRRQTESLVVMPSEPEQVSPRTARRTMEGQISNLAIAWPTVELSHPDLYPLDVAAYVLTQGESSRLVQLLRYQEQLVYSVQSSSYTPEFGPGWFSVQAVLAPPNKDKVRKAILEQIYRLKTELITETELKRAKAQKAAEHVFAHQTPQDQADSLGRSFIATGDPLFDSRYVDGIQTVTVEQIRTAAQRYFDEMRVNVAIIDPLEASTDTLVQDNSASSSPPIERHTLNNGVRVLVKKHDGAPLVNIQAFCIAGLLGETEETSGISSLTGSMLDQGSQHYTALEIAEYFDSIGGQFGVVTGRNTIYASAQVLPQDTVKAMSVLSDCFLRPEFADGPFQRQKQLALGAVARRQTNPQAELFEFFADSLPNSTPYHLTQGGKQQSLERLTPEDLRAFHSRFFVPENIVVSVFGDIESGKALQLVNEQFGELTDTQPFTAPVWDDHLRFTENIVRHKKTQKPAGMVIVAYPTISLNETKDYMSLMVLDTLMSGYGYPGGWLHEDLRKERQLVYGVHAIQLLGPKPGFFLVIAQTSPDQVGVTVERILVNMERARQGNITTDEVQKAKDLVVAQHAMNNITAGSQAQVAALDELYGLGYNHDADFNKRLNSVTLEDVKDVARRYFTHYVVTTTAPTDAPSVP